MLEFVLSGVLCSSMSNLIGSIDVPRNIINHQLYNKSYVSSQVANYLNEKLFYNLNRLESFKYLDYGWNGYNAESFPNTLIDLIKSQLYILKIQPEVFPTARKSIQLEYKRNNGDYLEFEVFNDKVIMYCETNDYENEEIIKLEDINKMVEDFYGRVQE